MIHASAYKQEVDRRQQLTQIESDLFSQHGGH